MIEAHQLQFGPYFRDKAWPDEVPGKLSLEILVLLKRYVLVPFLNVLVHREPGRLSGHAAAYVSWLEYKGAGEGEQRSLILGIAEI